MNNSTLFRHSAGAGKQLLLLLAFTLSLGTLQAATAGDGTTPGATLADITVGSVMMPQGCTSFIGDQTLGAGVQMVFDIEGTDSDCDGTGDTDYDVVSVDGDLDLNGATLSLMIQNGFEPERMDAFEIVNATTITGVIAGMDNMMSSSIITDNQGRSYQVAIDRTVTPQTITATYMPQVMIRNEVIRLCDGDPTFDLTLNMLPVRTTPYNISVNFGIRDAGTTDVSSSFTGQATVPADQDSVIVTIANSAGAGGFGQATFNTDEVTVTQVIDRPNTNPMLLPVDGDDFAELEVQALPTATIAYAAGQATTICESETVTVDFAGSPNMGTFDFDLNIYTNNSTTPLVLSQTDVDPTESFTFTEGATGSFSGDIDSISLTNLTRTLNTNECGQAVRTISITTPIETNDVMSGAVSTQTPTVCSGSTVTFDSDTDGSGDGDIITYQWFGSTTGESPLPAIMGATSASYETPVLTNETASNVTGQFFRQTISTLNDVVCTRRTSAMTVTVLPAVMATQPADEEICSRFTPAAVIDLTVPASNGRFAVTAVTQTTASGATPDPLVSGVRAAGTFGNDGDRLQGNLLTNLGSENVTITYSVTPYSFGPDGNDDQLAEMSDDCAGTPFQVAITVRPEPVVIITGDNEPDAACSGVGIGLVVPDDADGPGISSFTATVNTNGLAAGASNEPLTLQGNQITFTDFSEDNDVFVTDTYVNTGTTPVNVVYSITPTSAAGCIGQPFDLVVPINPEPVVSDQTVTDVVCSGNGVGVDFASSDMGSVATATYNVTQITLVDGAMLPEMANYTGTGLAADALQDDVFINTSGSDGTVTYTVTPVSAAGCAGDPFTVTVTVASTPMLSNAPADQSVTTGAGSTVCTQVVTFTAPTISGSCADMMGTISYVNVDNPTVTGPTEFASGEMLTATFPAGTTTVTFSVNDPAMTDNVASDMTFMVTVTDDTPPTYTTPVVAAQSNDAGECGADVTFAVTDLFDNCTAAPTVTFTDANGDEVESGDFFPVGTTTISVAVVDDANNAATTTTFDIVVNDTETPVIACPVDQTISLTNETDDDCMGTIADFMVSATDNCTDSDDLNFSWNFTGATMRTNSGEGTIDFSNEEFNKGVTNVGIAFSDDANPANPTPACTFTVTVTDDAEPQITSCPVAEISFCEGDMVTFAEPTFSDNCDASLMITQTIEDRNEDLLTGTDATDFNGSVPARTDGPFFVSTFATDDDNNVSEVCTFTISIVETPVVQNLAETTCDENDELSIALVGGVTNSMSIMNAGGELSYSITVDNNTNVSGQLAAAGAATADAITDELVNNTNEDQVVVYTVTPTATYDNSPSMNACAGPSFEVTVTVEPTPTIDAEISLNGGTLVDVEDEDIFFVCSDDGVEAVSGDVTNILNSLLISSETVPSVPGDLRVAILIEADGEFTNAADDLFPVTADLPLTGTSFELLSDIVANNINAVNVNVAFRFVPYIDNDDDEELGEDDCPGTPLEFTIVVRPEPSPVAEPATVQVCSDEEFSIDLNTYFTNLGEAAGDAMDDDLEGVTYEFTADAGPFTGFLMFSGLETSGTLNSVGNNLLIDEVTNDFNSPITITYTVVATSADGCVGEELVFDVILNNNPQPSLAIPVSSTICAGASLTINGSVNPDESNTAAGYTYSATLTNANGDAVGSIANDDTSSPTITAPADFTGDITFTFMVTDNATGCSGTAVRTIEVLPNPEAFDAVLEGCEDPSGSGLSSFELSDADDQVLGNDGPVIVVPNDQVLLKGGGNANLVVPGNFTVTYHTSRNDAEMGTAAIEQYGGPSTTVFARVTNSNTGCFDVSEVELIVLPTPLAPEVTDLTYCLGDDPAPFAAGVGAAAGAELIFYTSSAGDELAAAAPDTDVAGTTTVFVSQTVGQCESERAAFTVTVNPLPEVTATSAAENNTICAGSSVMLIAGGALSFQWTNGPAAATWTVSPTETTTFTVTGTDGNGCEATATIEIIVQPNTVVVNAGPDVVICEDGTFEAEDASVTDVSEVTWSTNGDGSFDDVNSLMAEYTPGAADKAAGSVTLTLTGVGENACDVVSVSDNVIVTITDQLSSGLALTPFMDGDTGVDFCLAGGPITLTDLLVGEDAGGDFVIESSAMGAIITGNTLNLDNVNAAGETVSFDISYTIGDEESTICDASTTNFTVVFEIGPSAGTTLGTGFVCSDATEFDLFELIDNETAGGTWQVITTNVGITVDPQTGMINPSEVLFLPNGTTNPVSRIVQFRYTVTGGDGTLCDDATVDATLQINQEAVGEVSTTEVNNTICYDGTASVSVALSLAARQGQGMWTTDGGGQFDDPTAEIAIYTPVEADWGTTVRLTYTTNDPDGPDRGGNFPFNPGICEADVDFVDIIVLDRPEAVAEFAGTVTPSLGTANEAVCTGATPTVTLSSPTTPDGSVVFDITASASAGIQGFTMTQTGVAEGAGVEPSALVNPDDVTGTVTYLVTPRDAGPDGDFGTDDDCDGPVTEVVILVDPTINFSFTVNENALSTLPPGDASTTVELCDGTGNLTLDDFVTSNGANNLVLSVEVTEVDNISVNGTAAMLGTTEQSFTDASAALAAITDLGLVNANVDGSITYEITAFYDRDGDGALDANETCSGRTLSFTVEVNPIPVVGLALQIDNESAGVITSGSDMNDFTGTVCSGTVFEAVSASTTMPNENVFVRVTLDNDDALLDGFTSGTFIAPLSQLNFSRTTLENETALPLNVNATITPFYAEGFTPGTDATIPAGACVGSDISFDVTVEPVPAITATVNGTAVSADANGQTFTVCSGADNVVVADLVSFTDEDGAATLVNVSITDLTNLSAPAAAQDDLTLAEARTFFADNTTFSLNDMEAEGSALVTLTPIFNDCAGTPVTFTVEVLPVPVIELTVTAPTQTTLSTDQGPATYNEVVCSPTDFTAALTSMTATAAGRDVFVRVQLTDSENVLGFSAGSELFAPVSAVDFNQLGITAANNAPTTITGVITPFIDEAGSTPTAITDQCTGDAITFTITLLPTPTAEAVDDRTVCFGESVGTGIDFASDTEGTTFDVVSSVDIGFGTSLTDVTSIDDFTATIAGTDPVTATITVTPSFTQGDVTCTGDAVMFTYTVNPEVVYSLAITSPSEVTLDADNTDFTTTVCGGSTFAATPTVSTPVNGAGDMLWVEVVLDDPLNSFGFGAGTSTLHAPAGQLSFNDVIENTSGQAVTITGTITPYFEGDAPATPNDASFDEDECSGTPLTFSVTLQPQPVLDAVADQEVCSDDDVDVTFTENTGATNVTVAWEITEANGVTATATTGTGNIDDLNLTNLTGATQIVSFSATASTDACASDAITFDVTVLPEAAAVATPSSQTVCSDEAFSVAFTESTGVTGTVTYDYTIVGDLPADVSLNGGAMTSGSGDIDALSVNNVSSDDAVITFSVVPTTEDGCVGDAVEFTVTVQPEPVGADVAFTVCSGTELNLVLQDFIDANNGVGATFIYFSEGLATPPTSAADAELFVSGNSNEGEENAGAATSITDILTNNSTQDYTIRYVISPTAVNGTCAGSSFNVDVTVEQRVQASIANNGVSSICTGETVTLSGNAILGTEPYSFDWTIMPSEGVTASIVGGDNTTQNIDLLATAGSGTVTVELVVTDDNGCVSEVTTQVITVNESLANAEILGDTEVCADDNATYSVEAQAGVTYFWSVLSGGVITSGQGTSSIDIAWADAAGGPHTIELQRSANGCTTTNEIEVTIDDVEADFSFLVDGNTVTFTNQSVATGTPSFSYTFGDGESDPSTEENPTFEYAENGTYEVCLTVTSGGCSDTFCDDVMIGECDVIQLNAGLNLISLDVSPDDPSADAVFGQLGSALINVQGRTNDVPNFYAPGDVFSDLQQVVDGAAYFVRVRESSVLTVCGTALESGTRKPIDGNITLVGYVNENPTPIEQYFASEINGDIPGFGELIIVTAIDPNFSDFVPNDVFSTISEVKNSFGYSVRMRSQPTTVNTTSPEVIDDLGNVDVTHTDAYDFVGSSTNLPDEYVGQIVTMIDARGTVIYHYEVIAGGYLKPTAIFTEDSYTGEAGHAEAGTELFFELDGQVVPGNIALSGNKQIIMADIDFDLNLLSTSTLDELAIDVELAAYPNPFTELINAKLTLSEAFESVSISVMNVEGRVITQLLSSETLQAGEYNYQWNASAAPAGLYLIQVEAAGVGQVAELRVVKQ